MARPLTDGETALAQGVFGEAIAYERVSIADGGFGGFAVTLGSRINVPAPSADYAGEPLGLQGFFIHEMVHVWQFQTRPLRTLASWARVALGGGYGPGLPGYRYDLPLKPWARLNLEQQASVVEHAFLLRAGWPGPAVPPSATPADYDGRTPFG